MPNDTRQKLITTSRLASEFKDRKILHFVDVCAYTSDYYHRFEFSRTFLVKLGKEFEKKTGKCLQLKLL